MTRDQAITRMLAAFPTPADGTQLANDMVFAQRLVMALQALDVVQLGEPQGEQQPEGVAAQPQQEVADDGATSGDQRTAR